MIPTATMQTKPAQASDLQARHAEGKPCLEFLLLLND